jgi:Bacterial type II/III secretion system short domain
MRTQMLIAAALVCLVWTGAQAQVGGKKPPLGDGGPKPDEPKIFKPKPAPPMRWEYLATGLGFTVEAIQSGLNDLAAEGWELVAIDPGAGGKAAKASVYVFRRPATAKPKADVKPAPQPAPKEKAESKLELRIYPLKHGNAVDLAHLIENVLQPNNLPMRVVADPRTNQVLVNGSAAAQEAVQALLDRLDRPARNEPAAFDKKKD